jgi:hypothetical protein
MDRPDRPSISCFAFCVFPMGETKDSPKRHCDHHEIPSHLQRCAARIVSRSIRRTQGIFFLSQAIHWKKAVCHKQRLQLSLPCTLHKPGIPLIFPHVFASRRTHMPCQSHSSSLWEQKAQCIHMPYGHMYAHAAPRNYRQSGSTP